ncbi:MAG: alpha/beta hydrolase [Cyclobacteriaceae bacterium]|nr:alpha/beta hydrolase [Cyclobacteriaceae bacterium]
MIYSIDQWRKKGKWLTYNGHQIFYVVEGTGEPLVLLHGFPTSSWDWHKLWDTLSQTYRVITLDFIGFGFSAKPKEYNYSIKDQASLVEQLLFDLRIDHYHLLAHDFGDTVAQELLARQLDRHENKIKSCCLLNGGLFPETHRATRTQKLLLGWFGSIVARMSTYERFVNSFTILFPNQTRPSDDELRMHYELIKHNNGHKITHLLIRYIIERQQNRDRWVTALQKAKIPLRLLDGLDDPVSGAHMVARYKELIPDADVTEISGCGHYPQMEVPEIILKNYAEFRSEFRFSINIDNDKLKL